MSQLKVLACAEEELKRLENGAQTVSLLLSRS